MRCRGLRTYVSDSLYGCIEVVKARLGVQPTPCDSLSCVNYLRLVKHVDICRCACSVSVLIAVQQTSKTVIRNFAHFRCSAHSICSSRKGARNCCFCISASISRDTGHATCTVTSRQGAAPREVAEAEEQFSMPCCSLEKNFQVFSNAVDGY